MQNLPNPAAPALWGHRVHPGVACSVTLDQQPRLTARLVQLHHKGSVRAFGGHVRAKKKKKFFCNIEHRAVLTVITVFGLKTQSLAISVSKDCTGCFMLTSNTYQDSENWCETSNRWELESLNPEDLSLHWACSSFQGTLKA